MSESNVVVIEPAKPAEPPRAMSPGEYLTLALRQNVGPEVLNKFFDLYERGRGLDARAEFDAAYSLAKGEFETIVRSRRSHNGKYADLATIQEQINPVLAKHGLSYRFRTEQPDKGTVKVTCIVAHRAGHAEETSLVSALDNTGNKNPVQSLGSTCTYLQRYTLNAALGLAAAYDDDGNGGGAPRSPDREGSRDNTITGAQLATIEKLFKESGADREKFCVVFNVPSVNALRSDDFGRAVDMLKVKKAAKAQKEAAQ